MYASSSKFSTAPILKLTQPFQDRLAAYARRIDQQLELALPKPDTSPYQLHEAMRYAVFNGGKRVRPLLSYAAGEVLDVDPGLLDVPAVAIELIHAFSLVHDDLPAMDNDDLRRGKPTVHIQFDEATAILAADALQPLAFAILAGSENIAATTRAELAQLIAHACGSRGMTGGQSIDLSSEGSNLSAAELEHMFALKTGALIHASIYSACLLCEGIDENDAGALYQFGQAIGIAFQIKDDILDVEGTTETIGKPAGSDELQDKATYPSLFGIDASRKRCDDLLQSALSQLDRFGDRAAPLEWLARYIVQRGQ